MSEVNGLTPEARISWTELPSVIQKDLQRILTEEDVLIEPLQRWVEQNALADLAMNVALDDACRGPLPDVCE